jgi:hypothetical protein
MGISYFDVWKKKMESNGGNIVQARINTSKDFFNRNFTEDPSYKLATLKKRDMNIADSNLDTRIINVDTDVYKKKIYVRPDTKIEAGDYIVYNDKTYLALSVEDNLISPYAHTNFCNYTLKWMIDGVLYSMPAIVTNNTKYTLGIKSVSSSSITEADGMFGAIISYNDIAKLIPLGKRFIVNGQAWEATQLDHSSVLNVLSILLGETSKITENDNLDLEIADYYQHKYTITLNSNTQSVVEGGSYQLSPTVKDDGKEVGNKNVVYLSSNPEIATVDSSGKVTALKTGISIITCSIGDIKADLSLSIIAKTTTPIINYTATWTNNNGSLLKLMSSSTSTFVKTLDGINDDTMIVSYTGDATFNSLLSQKKISITKVNDRSFTIKNIGVNTSMTINITFTDSISGVIIETKTIQLRGV